MQPHVIGLLISAAGRAIGGTVPSAPANLVTNGTFDDSSGWTLTGSGVISGGAFACSGPATAARDTNAPIIAGHYYKVTYDVTVADASLGSVSFSLGGGNPSTNRPTPAPGTSSDYVVAGATQEFLISTSGTVALDNVVVVEVTATPGAELIQNGGFDDASNWTLSDPALSISGGTLNWSAAGNLQSAINVPVEAIIADQWYLCSYRIVSRSSGTVKIVVGGALDVPKTAPGTYARLMRTNGNAAPKLWCGTNTTLVSDDVSVRRVTFSA